MKLNKKQVRNIIMGILLVLLVILFFLFLDYAYKKSSVESRQITANEFANCASKCGLEGVTAKMDGSGKVSIQCDSFQSLSNADKAKTLSAIDKKIEEKEEICNFKWEVVSYGDHYEYSSQFDFRKNGFLLDVGGNSSSSSKPSSKSEKTKDVCNVCNGTGWARYYVGGSALEAALNGYDDSYVVKCSSCGGTGYKYYGSGN